MYNLFNKILLYQDRQFSNSHMKFEIYKCHGIELFSWWCKRFCSAAQIPRLFLRSWFLHVSTPATWFSLFTGHEYDTGRCCKVPCNVMKSRAKETSRNRATEASARDEREFTLSCVLLSIVFWRRHLKELLHSLFHESLEFTKMFSNARRNDTRDFYQNPWQQPARNTQFR